MRTSASECILLLILSAQGCAIVHRASLSQVAGKLELGDHVIASAVPQADFQFGGIPFVIWADWKGAPYDLDIGAWDEDGRLSRLVISEIGVTYRDGSTSELATGWEADFEPSLRLRGRSARLLVDDAIRKNDNAEITLEGHVETVDGKSTAFRQTIRFEADSETQTGWFLSYVRAH